MVQKSIYIKYLDTLIRLDFAYAETSSRNGEVIAQKKPYLQVSVYEEQYRERIQGVELKP